jgi:hypothetical protein
VRELEPLRVFTAPLDGWIDRLGLQAEWALARADDAS